MAVRKRYYIWLAKAYLKKWKRTIFLSLVIGFAIFLTLVTAFNYYLLPLMQNKVENLGYTGVHTLNTVPEEIFTDVSYGLTKIDENGEAQPAAAESWEINDDGTEYVFKLKEGIEFHDGEELTAENLTLEFENVEKEIIDEYTVSYTLTSEYSPFIYSVSKPILKTNLAGLGDYQVRDLETNASFVESLTLQHVDDSARRRKILFYPTQEALKTAYALGEIDRAVGLSNTTYKDSQMHEWGNTHIQQDTNYSQLITIFYNNNDEMLSDKNVRVALNAALPQEFTGGIRADSPFPPTSPYYEKNVNYIVGDLEIARELLNTSSATQGAKFEIATTTEYEDVAKEVQSRWREIGIDTSLKIAARPPDTFQIFLTNFRVPQDPDQYTLWHSGQPNNIAGYQNLRIDKLLEDGRVTHSVSERKDLYADFQKYLMDDVPASFLYFPYSYTLSRN